jgi:methionine--tRNA ligase beta chain
MVSVNEFQKIDLRVAKIESVEEIEGKDKLYKIQLDVGETKKQTVSGIKPFYSKEELVGKQVVIVNGLDTSMVAGLKSETMLLAAKNKKEGYTVLFVPEEVPTGTAVE